MTTPTPFNQLVLRAILHKVTVRVKIVVAQKVMLLPEPQQVWPNPAVASVIYV